VIGFFTVFSALNFETNNTFSWLYGFLFYKFTYFIELLPRSIRPLSGHDLERLEAIVQNILQEKIEFFENLLLLQQKMENKFLSNDSKWIPSQSNTIAEEM